MFDDKGKQVTLSQGVWMPDRGAGPLGKISFFAYLHRSTSLISSEPLGVVKVLTCLGPHRGVGFPNLPPLLTYAFMNLDGKFPC